MTEEEIKVMRMALDALSPDPYRSEWLVAMDMDEAIKAINKCLANDALNKKAENARELGLSYD
jgi:glycine cleavage system H lipoate-binding protein